MLIGLLSFSMAFATASAAIQWHKCASELPFNSPKLECAELSVPLDWNDKGGKKITVGLNSLKGQRHLQPHRQPSHDSWWPC